MKQARHSLALSLISLVLCITMLLGSTWAWFTDSVTSTNNRISTGILDIELEYYNNGSWDKVTETTNIFREDTLWEPGHAEVVYFKISNLGSLALKYNFGVNVVSETLGINVSGDAFKLSDHIRYGVDLGKQPEYSGGQEAISAVSANSTPLNLRYSTQSTMNEGAPEAYLALVVYMPETVGNVANAKVGTAAPQINLGITLAATQNTVEADSFGPDYDAGAFFPDNNVDVMLSAPVVTDTENKSVSDVTVGSDDSVSALVPAGALIEPGTDTLTLKVSELETTNSNITVSDGEESRSLDVHVDGIADGNTVPVVVSIKELMPKGLNMGNYTLYHVENATPAIMTYVTGTPVNHNEFSYDPVTGDVVVAMKSFSEVATIAEVNKAWEGNADFTWYNEEAKELVIANADQLWALSQIVGGMEGNKQDSFAGKTVTLACDINLADGEEDGKIFYPIGYWNDEGIYAKNQDKAISSGFYTFEGTFDGNGHTISNIYQNTWEMKGDHNWYAPEDQHYRDGMGLFGKVYGGTVKNLTVDNFSSDGEIATTGVIAAYADFGASFENIAITNCNPRVYNIGNGGIVGCVGWYTKGETDDKVTFKNITADSSNKISALWGSYDVACGGIVGQYYPTSGQTSAGSPKNPGIDFESCNISAQIDVFNDVCGNYQYYAYRYAGMMIGSIRENETINGRVYPKMDGITAKDCKVHYETWNDYFYCELVANSLASYTHDHQFSRLERVKSVEGNTITKLDDTTFTVPAEGRYNYVVVEGEFATENATCYHFVDGVVWNHEDAGFENFDLDGNGELDDYKEDNAHIYLPFAQLFTGYGWGVTSKGLSDYEGIETMDITSTDQRESVKKFETKFENNTFVIGDGCAVTVGNLFEALDGISINNSGVFVSVESAENGKTIVGKFEANTDDWRKSTLTFNGTGLAKLTIQDYDYCIPTTLYIKVQEVAVGTDGVSLTIVGLSKDKTYEYAPATILDESKWTWTEVNEVSEIQVEEAGLWAVRVEGSSYCDYVLVGQTKMDASLYLDTSENKKKVNTTGSKVWTLDNWSSEYGTVANHSYRALTHAAISLGYVVPKSADALREDANGKFCYKYANPANKVIPIENFSTIKLQVHWGAITNTTDYESLWIGKTLKQTVGTVRIYVAESDVEYYEIPFTVGATDKNKSATHNINIQTSLEGKYTNVQGYVTGISILPFGGCAEWTLNEAYNGNSSGQFFLYLHDVTTSATPDAPDLSIVGDAYDGKYEIGGFDANTQYVVSTDLINFQSIGDAVTSYKVSNMGTYYFKAISSTGESPVTKVVIDGSRDTVTGLEAQNDQVTADKDYEWARYTYAGYSEWATLKAGDTLTLNDGLTAIRLPADETHAAGKPQLLYKAGENVGSIGLELNTSSITPVVGKWTNTIDLTTSTSLLYDLTTNPTRSFGMVSWFTQTADIGKNHYYTYTLAEDEIISAQSVAPISIRLSFGKGYMFNNGDAKAKLRFHIAGGLNDYYDIYFDSKTSPTNYTGDLSKVLPKNETGYLTGISFWPVYEVISGSYTESWANQTARIMLLGVEQVETWTASGNTTTDGLDQYRCRLNILK